MVFLVAGPKLNAKVVSGILHKIQCNSICSGDPYRLAYILQEFFKPSQIWRHAHVMITRNRSGKTSPF